MSNVSLRSIRSHFFGGVTTQVQGLPVQDRTVAAGTPRPVDMNGSYSVGQMYAMHYALAQPRFPLPILLWHGGGMTGAQWEATPDGRPGWLWRLLEAGFDVWVCDAPERGRASWAMFPEIYRSSPIFRSHEEAWDVFRIGPPGGYRAAAHLDTQFPVEHFDQFARQFVPRWLDHGEMALAAYDELIAAVGPCIVLGHSQGGGHAAHAAQRHPGLVRALVALEPTGMPAAAEIGIPQLVLWGDHLDQSPLWHTYRQSVDGYVQAMRQCGAPVTVLDLPAAGLHGNSHACMLDRNSDEVLARVIAWLSATSGSFSLAPHPPSK
ncbi:alpha/beta fold hydrolase [Bordetella sp. LUAb4]|uniref:alpha/beta fold hydrolase n=1 Tax=Bordetella sp. LUAb4 TaxID=2843195 RepID=UPI001E657C20|nr:alpha/beta fold hydrolase [Bordetella sp. LUAb4]